MEKKKSEKCSKPFWIILVMIGLSGLIVLSANTSPFYPDCYLDRNGTDAIRNMVVAREWIVSHKLPYRDLYCTGTVYTYLVMAAGFLLRGRTGVFAVQLLSFLASIFLIYKIVEEEKVLDQIIAVMLYLICFVGCYNLGAASVEFVMPLLLWINWCVVKGKWRKFFLTIGGLLFLQACFLLVTDSVGEYADIVCHYLIPVAQKQLVWDKLLMHRLVKALPSLVILVAGYSINDKRKKCYLYTVWVLMNLYLLLGEEAWYRYGVIAPFLPMSYCSIRKWTENGRGRNALKMVVCLLSAGSFLFAIPFFRNVKELHADVWSRNYMNEVSFIRECDEEDMDNTMLCLDSSAKYYLLLNKSPADRMYANQSLISSYDSRIADYMYEYLWNDEKKGYIFLYSSPDGWCPESIGHYAFTTVGIFDENINIYYWNEEESEHEDKH